MTLTYPAPAPIASGTTLTVDALAKAPKVLAKRIITDSTPFLSKSLFRGDTTDSGAVVYSAASIEDIYPSRGDAQQVEPGAEIPMVDVADGEQVVAVASKFGAGYIITDEAKDRNQLSVITKGNTKVRNALLRQDANRVFAAFRKAAPTTNATAVWTTAKALRRDVLSAVARIEGYRMGYSPTTVLIHPELATDIMLLDELQNLSPRENKDLNPLFNRQLADYLSINWITNPYMDPTEAIIMEPNVTGVNVVEKPYGVAVVREGTRERDVVIATQRSVPLIDEPLSALIIKGVR